MTKCTVPLCADRSAMYCTSAAAVAINYAFVFGLQKLVAARYGKKFAFRFA